MTVTELLINPNALSIVVGDYEQRLNMLLDYGTDEELSLMDTVLDDYGIEH